MSGNRAEAEATAAWAKCGSAPSHTTASNQQAHLFQRGCRGNGCLDGCDLLGRGARARCCRCRRCRRLSGPRHARSCLRLWEGARWWGHKDSAREPCNCPCSPTFHHLHTHTIPPTSKIVPPTHTHLRQLLLRLKGGGRLLRRRTVQPLRLLPLLCMIRAEPAAGR